MENKVKNSEWYLILIITVFVALFIGISLALLSITQNRVPWIPTAITLLLTAFLTFLLSIEPRYYVFTDEGVTIHFMFGRYRYYAWKSVTKIQRMRLNHYHHFYFVSGTVMGKKNSPVKSCNNIHITDKTKELMNTYWKGKIHEK